MENFLTAGTNMATEPTASLRFHNGTLQQCWRVTALWSGPTAPAPTTEWRDVPNVIDAITEAGPIPPAVLAAEAAPDKITKPTWKIIETDNYAREHVADKLVCDSIASERDGLIMLAALQESPSRFVSSWYHLVSADHRLSRGMADLV